MSSLQSLRYERGTLVVLDQLKLPLTSEYVAIEDSKDAWDAIRSMKVRGAPLIAIVAALGLAVDVHKRKSAFGSASEVSAFLIEMMTYLRTSRPTAVNLFTATDALTKYTEKLVSEQGATVSSVIDGFVLEAERMLADDVAANKAMGHFGAKRILEIVDREKIRVLTICNTGSLATAGYGTALGVVRSLFEMGRLEHVYACETRPYNQGARLTAYEIVADGLPGTLIADSMASALMAVKGVDCVVVGADRVTANGDTANKIGTYQLAIAAKYHNIPFFTAAPSTTIDLSMSCGAEIVIEQRPADELTNIFNQRIAAEGIAVWNPSFDVTPCSLIRGVITELGVAEATVAESRAGDGVIDLPAFLRAQSFADTERCSKAVQPTGAPSGYLRMTESSIAQYVSERPKLARLLDMDSSATAAVTAALLQVKEVGDGNINYVYIIEGLNGKKIVVKQALPYVRCVGESWPLSLNRATFERNALVEQRQCCPEHVPEVYHFDEKQAVIVMRFIAPPNIILRKALMQGMCINSFASHLGEFLAKTLFLSSALALQGGAFRLRVSEWSCNTAMCALSEKVIFSDPYTANCAMNHWTTPELDVFAAGLVQDVPLKLAAAHFKARFLGCTQALLHADLHTGSVMVHHESTFVIDPEFGFYGPMGFDIGALLSNLLMSYFSQAGATHGTSGYDEWLLLQISNMHDVFHTTFLKIWTDHNNGSGSDSKAAQAGELYTAALFSNSDALSQAQAAFMAGVWQDTLGFTGMKMIRRIVGIAHVADLESIADSSVRGACERRSLVLARELVMAGAAAGGAPVNFRDMASVIARARELFSKDIGGSVWPVVGI